MVTRVTGLLYEKTQDKNFWNLDIHVKSISIGWMEQKFHLLWFTPRVRLRSFWVPVLPPFTFVNMIVIYTLHSTLKRDKIITELFCNRHLLIIRKRIERNLSKLWYKWIIQLPGIGVWTSTLTVAVALTLVMWWVWGADDMDGGGLSPRLSSSLLEIEPGLVGTVVVSTTTSGSTTISCEEYWLGSSVMVVRETSEGIRG